MEIVGIRGYFSEKLHRVTIHFSPSINRDEDTPRRIGAPIHRSPMLGRALRSFSGLVEATPEELHLPRLISLVTPPSRCWRLRKVETVHLNGLEGREGRYE